MRVNFSKAKNLFGAIILGLFLAMPAQAEESIISSVTISNAKNNVNTYELNIDSTLEVPYKAHFEEDGSIYFDLKNARLAKNVGTIYDEVSNIDNVVVKQIDKSKVRIYVKGKNAQNTELIFANNLFEESTLTNTKKITINRPINEYKSTSLTDLDIQDDSQEWDDNSFNLEHLFMAILSMLKDGAAGIILILLSLAGIFVGLIKTLANKISQEKEPLIGLNKNNYEIGTQTIKPTIKKQPIKMLNEELPGVSQRNITLKNAQAELARAHEKYQAYLKEKYKNNPSKLQNNNINLDIIKQGIALNQYQKNNENPYKNQEVIKIKKDFTQNTAFEPQGKFQIPPRPKTTETIKKPEFKSAYIQRPDNKLNDFVKSEKKQTNMKFLESVTKIYEQSGRSDLASGLKNSISKAKQTI